ncbi:unnamed protein product, partial [marine sediment metagenome]
PGPLTVNNALEDKKRGSRVAPTTPKKGIKKGKVSLYRTLCLSKRLYFPYIKWGVFYP